MKAIQLKDFDAELVELKASKIDISTIAPTWAPRKGALCFVKGLKFLKDLSEYTQKKELILLVNPKLGESGAINLDDYAGVYQSDKINELMCSLSLYFYEEKYNDLNYLLDGRQLNSASIDPSSEVAQGVFIGDGVCIEKNVRIHSGCRLLPFSVIKEGSEIFPNTVVYPYVEIGRNCRIHSNCSIGADGFGYQFINGQHKKIWHFGSVVIHEDVEIGANSTVDGGTFTPTTIGKGSRIDNGVQIAHNVQIGKHVVICGKSGAAGSSRIDDYCVIGGGVGVGPGVHLEQGVQVAGGTIVSRSWPAGSKIGGYPESDMKSWIKMVSYLKKAVRK